MLRIPFRVLLGVAVGIAAHVAVVHGQTDETWVTEVIELSNLSLDQARELVDELYGGELHAVTGAYDTDRLILRGEASVVRAVVDLIKMVDPPDAPDPDWRTEFIQVQTYPLAYVMPLIQALPESHELQVGVDHRNRQLVVSGPTARIEDVRSLLAQIDHPPQSLKIELAFVRGTLRGDTKNIGSNFPPAMQSVVDTLLNNGFRSLELLAPMVLQTDAGEEFRQQAHYLEGQEYLEFEVSGEPKIRPGEERVQLALRASMQGLQVQVLNQPDKPHAWFHLETTVTTKLGVYTVLAAAPASTEQGNAIALVVRVTRN